MNSLAQLKVELKKNDDGSVSGMLPSGLLTWKVNQQSETNMPL